LFTTWTSLAVPGQPPPPRVRTWAPRITTPKPPQFFFPPSFRVEAIFFFLGPKGFWEGWYYFSHLSSFFLLPLLMGTPCFPGNLLSGAHPQYCNGFSVGVPLVPGWSIIFPTCQSTLFLFSRDAYLPPSLFLIFVVVRGLSNRRLADLVMDSRGLSFEGLMKPPPVASHPELHSPTLVSLPALVHFLSD